MTKRVSSPRKRGALPARRAEALRTSRSPAVASKLGCTAEALRQWVRKSEGPSPGSAAAQEAAEQRLRELERENRELKRANEILRKASAYFAAAELDRRPR